MASLNEIVGYERCSMVIPTHSYELPPYQLEMKIIAKVQNASPKKLEKLDFYMKRTKGYATCEIDQQNNTIKICSFSNLHTRDILFYITNHLDPNARET
uniref:Uncharacterized protein n=1 Tax=Physcomitrium patens TaxID=3218 RepID=A0A2K1K3F8_PHYPA|nr:hypothetical protein PHYPA_012786 [Physcomitrium patens]